MVGDDSDRAGNVGGIWVIHVFLTVWRTAREGDAVTLDDTPTRKVAHIRSRWLVMFSKNTVTTVTLSPLVL